ncbi:Helix-turn-helix domain-containing protein [Anaerocolumna jejuensis DSM 15929]|uniref:Helix-turn-helix domain-containing protein n=1 Tax=Anaerocolumna jejuensis DSM 15929 TaxID=1121322 RepID=A0A1M6ZNP9_9FIRM|nr:Helix-turn-helix domain-containing protein [Anaerocolumna jejuensis DSM 15929]
MRTKDVANAIRVNRSYLSKRFKDEDDETITDYIHKIKIELSIGLMESSTYHLNEIAELLGYRNYSYFSRVIKKCYHMSPVSI